MEKVSVKSRQGRCLKIGLMAIRFAKLVIWSLAEFGNKKKLLIGLEEGALREIV